MYNSWNQLKISYYITSEYIGSCKKICKNLPKLSGIVSTESCLGWLGIRGRLIL